MQRYPSMKMFMQSIAQVHGNFHLLNSEIYKVQTYFLFEHFNQILSQKMADKPEKVLPQETVEYYFWLLKIARADFKRELMEIVSILEIQPLLYNNEFSFKKIL